MSSPNIPLRLEGASAVLEALRSPDFGLHLSVLKALAGKPEKALEYEASSGELQAALIGLLQHARGGTHRYAVLSALFPFQQPELFWAEFQQATDLDLMLLLAARLGREPFDWLLPRLLQAFDADELDLRLEVIANMLASQTSLEPATAVKVAVLASRPTPQPPLDEEVWPAWRSLLEGRYEQKARALFESQLIGGPLLEAHWGELTLALKSWALEWLFPQDTLLELALQAPELREHLLALLAANPDVAAPWKSRLQAHWALANEAERAALVRVGVVVEDPVGEFHRASDRSLRCALLACWPLEAAWEEVLIQPDWQLRSAATERLAQLDVKPERLDEWTNSKHEGLRITALQLRPETV